MASYKVIYRNENPDWEPGCPLVINAVQISRNIETSEAFLQIKVENATDATAGGMTAHAVVTYSSGATQQIDIRELDADISPSDTFTLKPIKLESGDAIDARVLITKVDSGSLHWQTSLGPKRLPNTSSLALSEKAFGERKVRLGAAGENASVLNTSPAHGDGWWICGCGSVNVGTESCRKCTANLKTLLALEDEAQLELWADEREAARVQGIYEEASALQGKGDITSLEKAIGLFESIEAFEDSGERAATARDALSNARKAKNSRTRSIAIAIVATVATIAASYFIMTTTVIPNNTYKSALEMVEQGNYDEAIETFEQLGDFKDSPEQVIYAKKAKAIYLIDNGKHSEAVIIMKELVSGGTPIDDLVDAFLESVEQYANDGDFDNAYGLVQTLSQFTDTDDLMRSYALSAGDAEMDDGFFMSAVLWYQRAGDEGLVKEAEYSYVKANYNNENLTTYSYLQDLRDSGYLDSADLFEELYAWHIDLNDIYVQEEYSGYGGRVLLKFKMSGGEPNAELSFHVDFSKSGVLASNGRQDNWSGDYDFSVTMEEFEGLLERSGEDGYVIWRIEKNGHYLDYDLSPSLYSSLSVTVTITVGETQYSETIVLR